MQKIVIPYKGRGAVKAGRVLGSIFTLGLINISESARQDLEHWGLIFETNDYYHVVQYTNGGIKTMKSTSLKECKTSIYDCGLNPYDTWTYTVNFRRGLDLSDVNSYVRSLENYNSFTNNCQDFAEALIRKIS